MRWSFSDEIVPISICILERLASRYGEVAEEGKGSGVASKSYFRLNFVLHVGTGHEYPRSI